MANFSIQQALEPIPQPYKTWIGRPIFVPFLIIMVPYGAIVEGAGWCREVAGEAREAWKEIREW